MIDPADDTVRPRRAARSEPPREPNGLAWCIALISLVLPWFAVSLALAGLLLALRGQQLGWAVLAGAVALLVVDIAWMRMASAHSDEPGLNRRGSELIGRIVTVVEPITFGRGKVRAGDTVWIAEGPDVSAGARVVVIAIDGVVVRISPIGTG
jgi:membrane protein implicated in regulation of membrane protease activity